MAKPLDKRKIKQYCNDFLLRGNEGLSLLRVKEQSHDYLFVSDHFTGVNMSGDCGYKCLKILVVFFNLLFWLAGCTLFGLGIWLLSNKEEVAGDYTKLTGSINYKAAPILCVVIGVVTIVVAFLACCGAIKESQCMLGSYFGFIALIFVLEITAIVLTYVYREQIEKNLRGDIKDTLNRYKDHDYESVTRAIDEIQASFKCCGNDKYKDWFNTKWGRNNKGSVPKSCCKDPKDDTCNKNVTQELTKIYTKGCYDFVRKYLLNNLHVISGFGIWIAVIQIMGMIFGLCLCCQIRHGNDTYV